MKIALGCAGRACAIGEVAASAGVQGPHCKAGLLADAEIPKNHFQNIFDVNPAGETAKGVGRGA
jgi:hypothetical protein